MKKYELVVVLDARTSQDERDEAIKTIEDVLWKGSILKKDDIGAVDAAYNLSGKAWNNKIYVVSYYCDLEPDALLQVKSKILYVQGTTGSLW